MAKRDEFSFGGAPEPMLCSPDDLPDIVVDNGIELSEFAQELAHDWLQTGYAFTPDVIREAGRIAMDGIFASAGEYRREFRAPEGLVPPHWKEVPTLVEQMCEYVNAVDDNPLHAAAYILWRTSWIHPFYDGNGRVARELAYLALLVGHRMPEFPGSPAIPKPRRVRRASAPKRCVSARVTIL